MPQERIETFRPRPPGCKAELSDSGNGQTVPACMGGTALVGCNNADVCLSLPQIEADLPASLVRVISYSGEDRQVIKYITMVRRATIAEVDIP